MLSGREPMSVTDWGEHNLMKDKSKLGLMPEKGIKKRRRNKAKEKKEKAEKERRKLRRRKNNKCANPVTSGQRQANGALEFHVTR